MKTKNDMAIGNECFRRRSTFDRVRYIGELHSAFKKSNSQNYNESIFYVSFSLKQSLNAVQTTYTNERDIMIDLAKCFQSSLKNYNDKIDNEPDWDKKRTLANNYTSALKQGLLESGNPNIVEYGKHFEDMFVFSRGQNSPRQNNNSVWINTGDLYGKK